MSKLKPQVRKAVMLGSLCSFSYLAVYIARNTLSAVSPVLIEAGVFTKENIGTLSSLYFICYALGQLINGIVGDKIHAKYMMSLGLLFGAVGLFTFSRVTDPPLCYIAYGAVGFFLSMIYAPMAKTVSENIELHYATRCSLEYTLASFLGSPSAGLLAALIAWQGVFTVGSSLLALMATVCFVLFTLFERRGVVKYNQFDRPRGEGIISGIRTLTKHKIVKFSAIVMMTGIVRTSVVFWMPTYFNEYLGFSSETSALIFTVSTLVICFSAFLSVFIFERLRRNINLTMLIFFILSSVFFVLTFVFKSPVLNVGALIGAVMCSNASDSLIWSRYSPSLRDTGLVSTATGFLDFMSYMAAALSSKVFSGAVGIIGWGGLILVWTGLMLVALVISLPDAVKKNG